MELDGANRVQGRRSVCGSDTFTAHDPATGRPLPPLFHDATQAEVDAALAGATEAFRKLRRVAATARAAWLRAIAAELEACGEPLLARATAETGLPRARLEGERGRTCGQLRLFAGVVEEGSWVEARVEHALPERGPLPRPDLRRMLVPLGPVAVFGASNFPLAFSVAGGDTASALAAGCPVVVKAHPGHPGTSELVARAVLAAADRTGMPEGVFSLLHGRSHALGAALVQHPSTRAVAFTGSLAGGRALFDLAVARPEPIPVFAEMGSINPVFVLPGALDGEGAARCAAGLAQSVALGTGQFCTNPGLVVTLADARSSLFLDALAAALPDAPLGPMLHAGIREAYLTGLARQHGVDGVRVLRSGAGAADGTVHAGLAVVGAETFLANPVLHEEVFGPSTLVVQCTDRDAMQRVADNLAGQLTATVHGTGDELQTDPELLASLAGCAGRLVCNGFPTGVEVGTAMQHGGPYPATTDARTTSVGTAAIQRFARPVCFQDLPDTLLPAELQEANPRRIRRLEDGVWNDSPGDAHG
ncbi:MAG: aldehyde dehydrogenase (NADP(+)) [Planctomycetes bacterium]|nr:aldehyde dehydrogenase (NADP(+)) [Planctomycetota bacterium]